MTLFAKYISLIHKYIIITMYRYPLSLYVFFATPKRHSLTKTKYIKERKKNVEIKCFSPLHVSDHCFTLLYIP